jgi:threonine 3-dehydrogenase
LGGIVKALRKTMAGPGLEMVEVSRPAVGPEDALVRVSRTGICGTDVHIESWDEWAQEHVRAPLTLGHEFVGIIEELGANVDGFSVGDVVSGEGHVVCGRCRNCMAGRRVQCARTESVGVTRDGAFAEFVAMPAGNLWRHRPGIDLDIAAIFDPFGNAVHVATAFPVLGEDVLVTGAGPTGLLAALVARHAGARHIVVTDVSAYRRELAMKMGATAIVDPRTESLHDVVAELNMTEGFDVGFEMSGHAEAMRSMLDVMAHGSKVAVLGLPSEPFAIDWSQLVMNMLTVRGIYGRQMFETWYKMSVFVESGLDVSGVVTHRFAANEWADAFDIVRSGECGKVILNWENP